MPDSWAVGGSAVANPGPYPALRLDPHITAAEALAVFRRKLPDAQASVEAVVHPFWWTALEVRTRGVLALPSWRTRDAHAPGQRLNVLVNAIGGKGFIADFDPHGAAVSPTEWASALDPGPSIGADEASRVAHSLVRTKVLRTVKLGMRIDIDEVGSPRGVLKPNWLVTGENGKHRATILVDGLDSSHYIVRVEKL